MKFSNKTLLIITAMLLCMSFGFTVQVALAGTVMTDTITQYGITWKLSTQCPVGQFVTGDYYVVGNCTVVSINPPFAGGRNGSELNPALNAAHSGYDSRAGDSLNGYVWDAGMCVTPPISMKPGDALVSTISAANPSTIVPWLAVTGAGSCSPVLSACVLTCLSSAVPDDAFRPSYCDRTQKIYLASNLKRNILPSLPYGKDTFVTATGTIPLSEFEDHYKRVWLNLVFFSFDVPVEYQPHYGHTLGRAMGMASLILMTDLPPARKEKLLIGFVQNGIDLWGIVKAGFGGWGAFGGHGTGRKWPIIFAGKMLGDTEMAQPTVTYPNLQFGEDMQTLAKPSWTGAKVVYAGHRGVDKYGNDVDSKVGWGQYEHLQPKDWPIEPAEPGMNEMYRHCCTSNGWIGMMLCAKMMHSEKKWNHDAFFDYCDRWMTEDDTTFVQVIKTQTNFSPYPAGGLSLSADQKKTWDPFVDEMWAKWRNNLPADLDTTTVTSSSGGQEGRIVVYPNPAKISTSNGNTIKLTNFVSNSIVKIYNNQGQLVTTITPGTIRGKTKYVFGTVAEWDGTNDSNENVSAGVYYCITDDGNGNNRKGKIALLK